METEITDKVEEEVEVFPERHEGERVSWRSVNGITSGTISKVLEGGHYLAETRTATVLVFEKSILN